MNSIYKKLPNYQTRWASFENQKAEKGAGGTANSGAKGHANHAFGPGMSHVLMEAEGSGIIQRIWMTIGNRSPKLLRGIKLEMFWDGCEKPAVSVPLGDFFGNNLSKMVPFEAEFISNPEARSFNCRFPMPFRKGARIVITNETDEDADSLFYDVDYALCPVDDDALYFHAFWNRENPTVLERNYTILPTVKGEGKIVGVTVGVNTDPRYGDCWYGEGEVKVFLDGDTDYPTLCGTGTEDYIGTAWGQEVYSNLFQGSLISDRQTGEYVFYRFHKDDPIYFTEDARMEIQSLAGEMKMKIKKIYDTGVPMCVVCEGYPDKKDEVYSETEEGFCAFFTENDYTSVCYFYLDAPQSELSRLPEVEKRIEASDFSRTRN